MVFSVNFNNMTRVIPTLSEIPSLSVLTGFGWSIVFIIWEQEKKLNTTKEVSGKVVQPALEPSTFTKIL